MNPKKPVTLSMWHIYGEQTDSPLNQLVQEFNATVGKEKGIVIKVTNMTTTPDLKNQLLAAKEGAPGAPSMPDLFSSRPDTVLNLGAENLARRIWWISTTIFPRKNCRSMCRNL